MITLQDSLAHSRNI